MDLFNTQIHNWYSIFQRDLPWRNSRNPYLIWLSEIILQQTRISQGLAYYLKFTEEFPTIIELANASEDQILKLWQGLGYYSRARNLHFTAKFIQKEYNGQFPTDYKSIRALKGIGDYTAAAIASISFNLEYPAIDGNVYRVLSRYFGISTPTDTSEGKKTFGELARELIKGTDPGMHNQALMEFGALQCTPKNPDCNRCPLNEQCTAFASNRINELPVKQNTTKQRKRYFNYLVLLNKKHLWLRRRVEKDIWKNLFEFPIFETTEEIGHESLMQNILAIEYIKQNKPLIESISNWQVHLLSHQRIHYRFIKIRLAEEIGIPSNYIQVNKEDISNFAVPKLLETFIDQILQK